MAGSAEADKSSKGVLLFEGGPSAVAWIIPIGILVVGAMSAARAPSATASGGILVGCLLVAAMFSLIVSRRQIAEIDLNTRRLRILRKSFGRLTRTLVDYPFDQCRRLGQTEYESEGHFSYGVYVELDDGSRHAIPLASSDIAEARRVASLLSEATGIPNNLDVRF